MNSTLSLNPAEAIELAKLVEVPTEGIASRVIAKTSGGNLTVFAFDSGQELSEHSAPFDALILALDGRLELTIGGEKTVATEGHIVRMPANVPHSVFAIEASKMLLIMLREPASQA